MLDVSSVSLACCQMIVVSVDCGVALLPNGNTSLKKITFFLLNKKYKQMEILYLNFFLLF